jgi:hypothetical protein
MYGIPANLDLSRFVGAELIQLCAGQFQCQFHFDPPTSICVERRWELRDESGQLLDVAVEGTPAGTLNSTVLLGKKIIKTSINVPHSLSLHFESGHVLTIFNDSEPYESFTIQPGNIIV